MVKLRLRRMGAKKAPFYRIVVADSTAPRDGAFIEEIGYYNPLANPVEMVVDNEKAVAWIKKEWDLASAILFTKSVLDV